MHFRNPPPLTPEKRDLIAQWLGCKDAKSAHSPPEPPNMRPCTAHAIFGMLGSYQATAELHHSYAKRSHGRWSTYTVFVYGDGHYCARGGYVIEVVNDYPANTVNFHTWASCEHDYVRKTIGNCLNQYKCSKCGTVHEVDSSD